MVDILLLCERPLVSCTSWLVAKILMINEFVLLRVLGG